MYMDALESEVESLSAEVTRLRLMLCRVTQVMGLPEGTAAAFQPTHEDPVTASLQHNHRSQYNSNVSLSPQPQRAAHTLDALHHLVSSYQSTQQPLAELVALLTKRELEREDYDEESDGDSESSRRKRRVRDRKRRSRHNRRRHHRSSSSSSASASSRSSSSLARADSRNEVSERKDKKRDSKTKHTQADPKKRQDANKQQEQQEDLRRHGNGNDQASETSAASVSHLSSEVAQATLLAANRLTRRGTMAPTDAVTKGTRNTQNQQNRLQLPTLGSGRKASLPAKDEPEQQTKGSHGPNANSATAKQHEKPEATLTTAPRPAEQSVSNGDFYAGGASMTAHSLPPAHAGVPSGDDDDDSSVLPPPPVPVIPDREAPRLSVLERLKLQEKQQKQQEQSSHKDRRTSSTTGDDGDDSSMLVKPPPRDGAGGAATAESEGGLGPRKKESLLLLEPRTDANMARLPVFGTTRDSDDSEASGSGNGPQMGAASPSYGAASAAGYSYSAVWSQFQGQSSAQAVTPANISPEDGAGLGGGQSPGEGAANDPNVGAAEVSPAASAALGISNPAFRDYSPGNYSYSILGHSFQLSPTSVSINHSKKFRRDSDAEQTASAALPPPPPPPVVPTSNASGASSPRERQQQHETTSPSPRDQIPPASRGQPKQSIVTADNSSSSSNDSSEVPFSGPRISESPREETLQTPGGTKIQANTTGNDGNGTAAGGADDHTTADTNMAFGPLRPSFTPRTSTTTPSKMDMRAGGAGLANVPMRTPVSHKTVFDRLREQADSSGSDDDGNTPRIQSRRHSIASSLRRGSLVDMPVTQRRASDAAERNSPSSQQRGLPSPGDNEEVVNQGSPRSGHAREATMLSSHHDYMKGASTSHVSAGEYDLGLDNSRSQQSFSQFKRPPEDTGELPSLGYYSF